MGRRGRKVPNLPSFMVRRAVEQLLDIRLAKQLPMPPMRCTCHGGALYACPARPAMFTIVDEESARAALARLDAAVELWVITEDEADAVRIRAESYLS